MTKNEIIAVFKSFAKSQGFYGRLVRDIECGDRGAQKFLNHLAEKNFQNEIDLILYVECG